MIDTLLVLMGIENRHIIAANLIRAGRNPDEPVAFIERGSTDREKVIVTKLSEVARGQVKVSSPAVFVIGQVVTMRKHLKRIAQETTREEIYAGRTTATSS